MAKKTNRDLNEKMGMMIRDLDENVRNGKSNAIELAQGKKVACTRLRKNLKAIMDLAKEARKLAVEIRDQI